MALKPGPEPWRAFAKNLHVVGLSAKPTAARRLLRRGCNWSRGELRKVLSSTKTDICVVGADARREAGKVPRASLFVAIAPCHSTALLCCGLALVKALRRVEGVNIFRLGGGGLVWVPHCTPQLLSLLRPGRLAGNKLGLNLYPRSCVIVVLPAPAVCLRRVRRRRRSRTLCNLAGAVWHGFCPWWGKHLFARIRFLYLAAVQFIRGCCPEGGLCSQPDVEYKVMVGALCQSALFASR